MKFISKSTLETVAKQANHSVSCAGGTMKKYIYFVAVLFVLSMCAAPLWAQMEGSIRGTVTDQSGKPIPNATVRLYDAQNGRKYEIKTNDKGEYRSIGIYLGTYKATLIVNGNAVDEHNGVPIYAGQEQVVPFDLAKDLGGASGISDEQRKKMEEAQKQNEKIKGLNASLQQAKELEGAGNYDQAITVLQQATQVDPNQDLVWAYLGDAQRGAKKYSDAVESYQKALALKPTSGPYMSQLADAYAKSGQTDKAVQQYAAAAQADPQNAAAYYYNEGAVLTNTGKIDEAIAAFDKALQLDPNRADAYYWKGVDMIGKATMKDNKMVAPPGTAEAFNKYLELQPTGKYADAAKQMLAQIGASVETSYGKAKSSSGKKKP
jgi:tetratricopeptide (TPR) repeat protein